MSCKHPTTYKVVAGGALDWCTPCPWCDIERLRSERDGHLAVCHRLRGNLSLAEERLANAMQAITEARALLEPLAKYDPAIRAWLRLNAIREEKP